MAREDGDGPEPSGIPHAGRTIRACRDEQRAIWTVCDAVMEPGCANEVSTRRGTGSSQIRMPVLSTPGTTRPPCPG